MRRRAASRIALSLGLALLGPGCGSSAAPPPDTAKQAASDASARLEGSWTLVDFQPAQPLEPMLQALLSAQMNQLVVTFHAGKMSIQGAGLSAERTFTVTSAAADGFSADITDPTNVVYQVNGAFQGQMLGFTSLTDPWRGQGRLQRAR
jgi:hypothetical protein